MYINVVYYFTTFGHWLLYTKKIKNNRYLQKTNINNTKRSNALTIVNYIPELQQPLEN